MCTTSPCQGFGGLPPVVLTLAVLASVLAACSSSGSGGARFDSAKGVSASPRIIADGRPVPKGGGTYKIGAPYRVSGRWHVPQENPDYDRVGVASWYGSDFHGRRTANGEIYDMSALTAAHPTLPLPSYVHVTNLQNRRTILVRINDRGPYAHGRIIDLSQRAARLLDVEERGVAHVRVQYAGRAPLSGDDRWEEAFLARQPWYRSFSERRMAARNSDYIRR